MKEFLDEKVNLVNSDGALVSRELGCYWLSCTCTGSGASPCASPCAGTCACTGSGTGTGTGSGTGSGTCTNTTAGSRDV